MCIEHTDLVYIYQYIIYTKSNRKIIYMYENKQKIVCMYGYAACKISMYRKSSIQTVEVEKSSKSNKYNEIADSTVEVDSKNIRRSRKHTKKIKHNGINMYRSATYDILDSTVEVGRSRISYKPWCFFLKPRAAGGDGASISSTLVLLPQPWCFNLIQLCGRNKRLFST